jgi:hypothetical protein
MSDEKLSQTVLCSLSDADIDALNEYAAVVGQATGGAVLSLSRAARVRALFRLGVECFRERRRSGETKTKTKTT